MDFNAPFANSFYNGSKSISYLGPKKWDAVPSEITEINSRMTFKG